MEPNNWSQFFIDKNGSKRINPLALVFIIFQVILLVAIIITIIWVNSDKIADNDATRYEKIPELTIKDLAKKAPSLSEQEIAGIQKKLFQIVSANTTTINVDKIEATIRDDKTHEQKFEHDAKYLNMIIDIPSLKQSYQVFYSTNAIIDPDITTFVLCLDEHTEAIYGDFNCKTTDNESIRETIVSSYLNYFNFEYFSVYIDSKDPETIIISPSVTYNNSESTKASFIKEVKDAIDSLGMYPNAYEYYVRTAKDVNYKNSY